MAAWSNSKSAWSSSGGKGAWSGKTSWGSSAGGKGGAKGKSHKKQDESWKGGWDGEEEWRETGEDGQKGGRTTRILVRYQLPKAILRASVGQDGSAFFKKDGQKQSDQQFLGRKSMQQLMTADSSHLLRRPGVGLSEACASWDAAREVLKQLANNADEVGFAELTALLEDETVLRAMAVLNKTGGEQDRSKDNVGKSLEVLINFFKTHKKKLHELAANCAIASSRLYLGSLALLQLNTAMGAKTWWAEQLPEAICDSKDAKSWRRDSESSYKMHKALAQIFVQKIEEDATWAGGNNAASQVFRRRRPETGSDNSGSGDSGSDDQAGKSNKKKNKKAQPKKGAKGSGKEKKDKAKRKKKSSSGSSETDEAASEDSDQSESGSGSSHAKKRKSKVHKNKKDQSKKNAKESGKAKHEKTKRGRRDRSGSSEANHDEGKKPKKGKNADDVKENQKDRETDGDGGEPEGRTEGGRRQQASAFSGGSLVNDAAYAHSLQKRENAGALASMTENKPEDNETAAKEAAAQQADEAKKKKRQPCCKLRKPRKKKRQPRSKQTRPRKKKRQPRSKQTKLRKKKRQPRRKQRSQRHRNMPPPRRRHRWWLSDEAAGFPPFLRGILFPRCVGSCPRPR